MYSPDFFSNLSKKIQDLAELQKQNGVPSDEINQSAKDFITSEFFLYQTEVQTRIRFLLLANTEESQKNMITSKSTIFSRYPSGSKISSNIICDILVDMKTQPEKMLNEFYDFWIKSSPESLENAYFTLISLPTMLRSYNTIEESEIMLQIIKIAFEKGKSDNSHKLFAEKLLISFMIWDFTWLNQFTIELSRSDTFLGMNIKFFYAIINSLAKMRRTVQEALKCYIETFGENEMIEFIASEFMRNPIIKKFLNQSDLLYGPFQEIFSEEEINSFRVDALSQMRDSENKDISISDLTSRLCKAYAEECDPKFSVRTLRIVISIYDIALAEMFHTQLKGTKETLSEFLIDPTNANKFIFYTVNPSFLTPTESQLKVKVTYPEEPKLGLLAKWNEIKSRASSINNDVMSSIPGIYFKDNYRIDERSANNDTLYFLQCYESELKANAQMTNKILAIPQEKTIGITPRITIKEQRENAITILNYALYDSLLGTKFTFGIKSAIKAIQNKATNDPDFNKLNQTLITILKEIAQEKTVIPIPNPEIPLLNCLPPNLKEEITAIFEMTDEASQLFLSQFTHLLPSHLGKCVQFIADNFEAEKSKTNNFQLLKYVGSIWRNYSVFLTKQNMENRVPSTLIILLAGFMHFLYTQENEMTEQEKQEILEKSIKRANRFSAIVKALANDIDKNKISLDYDEHKEMLDAIKQFAQYI